MRGAIHDEPCMGKGIAAGWVMPHASRGGTRSGRSALAMKERGEQRASDETWR